LKEKERLFKIRGQYFLMWQEEWDSNPCPSTRLPVRHKSQGMDLLHEDVSRDHVELDVFQEGVKNLKINKLITNFNYMLHTLRIF
jgi:hypothetical protein